MQSRLPALAAVLACILLLGCSSDDADDDPGADTSAEVAEDDSTDGGTKDAAAGREGAVTTEPSDTAEDEFDLGISADAGHAETIAALAQLLPADTRGVAALDVDGLVTDGSTADVAELLGGEGADPALGELFGALATLADPADVSRVMTSALLAQTTDAAEGPFLVARVRGDTLAEIAAGRVPTRDGTYGPAARALYEDATGHHLTLLPGGVLVVGTTPAVESVLDIADGTEPGGDSAIAPFLVALDGESHLSFVYGLPALFDDLTTDLTLRSAAVVSGAFDVTDGRIGGAMAFHTANASEFVATFNALNVSSTQGADPLDQPLTLADPVVDDLGQVVVTVPPGPLDPTHEELVASRNLFRKLFADMEALDYAEDVAGRTSPAWLDFVVRSEADVAAPPSPGSVYIRWEFRDQAAVEAFEQNELPAGFRLAPTRFLESDDPDGEIFLALNLYNAGGGSIVTGARAEWDVFVHPPVGADPDAGERPRFFVVEALAEEVSADAGDLLTPAQPLSHELVDGVVVSDVRRFEGDGEVPVFASTFPVPDPATADVARFTREMAIGNDYIYWAHGVSDRVLYNATTFNHDAYLVDTEQLTFSDDSRWAQYLKPEVKDAVYYVNTLEYVASPMANLDSEHLDITPEWLAELVGFTTNGHQSGLMRTAVEQSFRGEADPFVGVKVLNDTPATYFNFEITDPGGLAAVLDLPPGHDLAPTTLFEDGAEGHYLTLSVYETDGAFEGTRAEWSVYVDDGGGRPPHMMIVELMTEEVAYDPYHVINVPSDVHHFLDDGVVTTRLSSPTITFDASFETSATTRRELSLDWIEAGDIVCHLDDICDLHYYDAETLDVPVQVPADVSVSELSTPWGAFVSPTPAAAFFRDTAQDYAVKRWYNLDVMVDELPFSGLDDPTHAISGSGNLIGRTSNVADSDYTYSGDAVLDGDQLTFALDQQVVNALGVGHIFTTGSFDLATGTGTQTVVDCQGPALLCSDIENGSTEFYAVENLDASDPDAITWQVDVVVDLGGSFGTADSASAFTATLVG